MEYTTNTTQNQRRRWRREDLTKAPSNLALSSSIFTPQMKGLSWYGKAAGKAAEAFSLHFLPKTPEIFCQKAPGLQCDEKLP